VELALALGIVAVTVAMAVWHALKSHKLFKTLSSTVAVGLDRTSRPVASPDYLRMLKYSCV